MRNAGLCKNKIDRRNTVAGAAMLVFLGAAWPSSGEALYPLQVQTRSTYRYSNDEQTLLGNINVISERASVSNFLTLHPYARQLLSTLIHHAPTNAQTNKFSIELWQSPVDAEQHLRFTIHANAEDADVRTELENQLFEFIENDEELVNGLRHVILAVA